MTNNTRAGAPITSAKSAKSAKSVDSVSSAKTAMTAAGSFPIVAIGASAGGLEALEQLLGGVPVGSGMAFVVIQHLDPTRKGMMPELLQRATPMLVAQAKNRMKVKPDCVYVIPPNRDLSILHDRLLLLEPVTPRGLRLPIDFFFRALADERRENAIGVVLSGMGSDGTLGLRAIKERGGFVLVQDPADAKFDSMPRSAIDAGLADIVGKADELAQRIVDILGRAPRVATGAAAAEPESVAQKSAFERICIVLRERTSHDFSLYKKTTLYRRIERRMAIHQIGRIADYVRYLRETPQEVDLLFKELLIGVTRFFRDPAAWTALHDDALPALLAAHPAGSVLRAWVAGCSTGEEAYSLAIAFREAQQKIPLGARHALQIFATDLDADAIERARQGVYPANIAADVSEARLKRYFVECDDGKGYRVVKEIREMIVFATHNVIMDPPFTRLDIVTCRNLLIYLGSELQGKLLPLFHYSLNPDGILMLGSAESIGSCGDLFAPLAGGARLFRRSSSPLRPADLEFPTRHSAKIIDSLMMRPTADPGAHLQALADQLLLQRFSPAAVLVNAAGDLIYINGRTGKYLEPAAGKVNWNIHAMARQELRQEIALALPKALRSGETVVYHNLPIDSAGEPHRGAQLIDLTVFPIDEPVALRGMAMVLFSQASTPAAAASVLAAPRGRRVSAREAALEQALALAHQDKQALREEMQTAQEELKSSNEELQSTNEELQSTNEELTTSKEEMQSLNEELQTVNSELQTKVDELSSSSSDMKNLFNSTDMATVFLDSALHIRRFTTQATRLFKLIPGDVGRALGDIVSDLVYPQLIADARQVLGSLAASDREMVTHDGRWFQVKIMPYRTLDNVIDGVVITFNDISRAKDLEAELRVVGRTTNKTGEPS